MGLIRSVHDQCHMTIREPDGGRITVRNGNGEPASRYLRIVVERPNGPTHVITMTRKPDTSNLIVNIDSPEDCAIDREGQ